VNISVVELSSVEKNIRYWFGQNKWKSEVGKDGNILHPELRMARCCKHYSRKSKYQGYAQVNWDKIKDICGKRKRKKTVKKEVNKKIDSAIIFSR
jgi:hypothetical protein